jgi:hypothetical protein
VREQQSAFWVDYAGKGEKAEYAANPYRALKDEKQRPSAKTRERPQPKADAEGAPAAGQVTDPEPPPEPESNAKAATDERRAAETLPGGSGPPRGTTGQAVPPAL